MNNIILLLVFITMLIWLPVISYYHEKDIIQQIKETGKCTTACWTNNIIIGEVISKQ